MVNTTFDQNNRNFPVNKDSKHRIPLSVEIPPDSGTYEDFYNLPDDLLQAFGIRLPQNEVHVKSEQELFDEFGNPPTIPNAANFELHRDASFIQTVGIKLGTTVRFYNIQNSKNIQHFYNNTIDPMFSNINTGDEVKAFEIRHFLGGGVNGNQETLVRLGGEENFIIADCTFGFLKSIGKITDFQGLSMVHSQFGEISEGFEMQAEIGLIEVCTFLNEAVTASPGRTCLDVLTNPNKAQALQIINSAIQLLVDEFFIWIDPNTEEDSRFILEDIRNLGAGTIFKVGLNGLADVTSASGDALFTTAAANGITDGEFVAITDPFASGYKGLTGRAIVDSATTFRIEGVDFGSVASDVEWTTRSLGVNDSGVFVGDPRITIRGVDGLANSMNQAEMRSNAANEPIIVPVGADGVWEPIANAVPATDDFIQESGTENATIDTETGAITNDSKILVQTRTEFDVTVVHSSGSSQTIDLALEVNGVIQTKSIVSGTTPLTNNFIGLIDYPAGAVIRIMRKRDATSANTLDATGIRLLYR